MKRKVLSLRIETLRTLSAAELNLARGRAGTEEETGGLTLVDVTRDEDVVTRDCEPVTTDTSRTSEHRLE